MKMIFKLMGLMWMLFKFVAITAVLTQFVLVTAMFGKGFLNQKKIDTIRAIYSGVDYEGIRKKAILADLTKKRDPFQVSKTELIETRRNAIGRQAGKVSLKEIRLQNSGQRFSEIEVNFSTRVDDLEKEIHARTRKQLQRMFSNMDVGQKKDILVTFIKKNGIKDALFLVKTLSSGAQRKLFAELKSDEEKVLVGDILRQVRMGEKEEGS